MRTLDQENGDHDLTSAATVLTTTVPSATTLADIVLHVGDGSNDLGAAEETGLTVGIAVDGVSVYGTDPTVTVASGRNRLRQALEPFPVAAGETVVVTLRSDNSGDTAVHVAAVLRDAAPLQPLIRGRTVAVDASGRTDVGAIAGAADVDGQTLAGAARIVLAALAGEVSGAADGPVVIRAADGSKPRISAAGDADGNRSAVALDGS